MTIEDLIKKLEKNNKIDALAITGSGGSGELNPASDYDLLIIAYDKPQCLMSGATEIDGRFTDLGFATVVEVQTIYRDLGDSLVVNGRYTTMVRSLINAYIPFDKSGILTRLQQKYKRELTYVHLQEGELISRLDKASYNLAHTKRKMTSSSPDYLMAVDLRMLYQLADLMVDYFLVRSQPWPGEKEAILYWKSNDSEYYNLFRKCLYETDRQNRIKYYEQLANDTMKPVGHLWHTGETRFRLNPETEMTEKNLNETKLFWDSLLI